MSTPVTKVRLKQIEQLTAWLYRVADKLMSILINCKPKEASHCEKANLVGEMMKDVVKEAKK